MNQTSIYFKIQMFKRILFFQILPMFVTHKTQNEIKYKRHRLNTFVFNNFMTSSFLFWCFNVFVFVFVLPCHEVGPFREAVFEPKGEECVDVTLKVSWHRPAARFRKVDGRHGQHEAVQVVALGWAQVDLKWNRKIKMRS